jgi:hypothetical protein
MEAFRTWITIGLLAATCAGCDEEAGFEVPPRDDSPVQTDQLEYATNARAVATYTNRGNAAVLYRRCNTGSTEPMYDLVRAAPDSGAHVFGPVWACVGGVAAGVLNPGDTLTLEVPLEVAEEGHSPPTSMDERTGLFRVVLDLYETFNAETEHGVALPDAARQSNVFKIHPPE